jgi:signal transduction histidine kinase
MKERDGRQEDKMLLTREEVVEEQQRQAEHLRVVTQLVVWCEKMSELAREMGTPLNLILGHAESLLERTEDESAQAGLQSIVRQVDRIIPLREQLCALAHGLRNEPHAPDSRQ